MCRLPCVGTSTGPLKAEVVFDGPLRAPFSKGDKLAELVVTPEGLPETRVPLQASESVGPYGFVSRLTAAARHLLVRLNSGPEDAAEGAT